MAKVTYKTRLKDVSALKSTGLSQLHQRITLLNYVFEDSDFRADVGGDDFALAKVLNNYVDDCALTFLELRAVMKEFPTEGQWSLQPLRNLYAAAVAKSKPPVEHDENKTARRTASMKDIDALTSKLEEKEFLVKTLGNEVSELRQENRKLLADNARLEGRIVELERSIERSGARQVSGIAR